MVVKAFIIMSESKIGKFMSTIAEVLASALNCACKITPPYYIIEGLLVSYNIRGQFCCPDISVCYSFGEHTLILCGNAESDSNSEKLIN